MRFKPDVRLVVQAVKTDPTVGSRAKLLVEMGDPAGSPGGGNGNAGVERVVAGEVEWFILFSIRVANDAAATVNAFGVIGIGRRALVEV